MEYGAAADTDDGPHADAGGRVLDLDAKNSPDAFAAALKASDDDGASLQSLALSMSLDGTFASSAASATVTAEGHRAGSGGADEAKEVRLTLAGGTPADLPAALAEIGARPVEGGISVRFDPKASSAGAIIAAVVAAGLEISDVTTDEPDLEEVFLEITGGAA